MKPIPNLPPTKNAPEPPKKKPEYFLNRAIKLLSYRPRSTAEISTRLRYAGADSAVIDQVITKLTDLDLLDDLKFAQWWVEQRVNSSPRGNRALSAELFQKGIDREIINSVLLSEDKEKELAEKLLKKHKWDKIKTQRFLYSKGFTSFNYYR